MTDDHSAYHDRIETLATEASRARETFDPPADPPDEDRAMEFLREGLGPAVSVYVEAHTGDRARFSPPEMDRLHDALNGFLELYAACYGVDIEADVSIREAAELLVDTHNIHDVAQVLTHVPDRAER